MNFFKQIVAEAKNMLRSKFIFISVILVLVFVVVGVPLLGLLMDKIQDNVSSSYYYYSEPLIVDGVTIDPDNDYYWEIQNLLEQQEYLHEWLEGEAAQGYGYELTDMYLDFYVTYATLLTPLDEDYNSDYRAGLIYNMRNYMTNLYVLGVVDPDVAALTLAVESIGYGSTSVDTLLKMSNEEVEEYRTTAQQNLDDFDGLMKNNDFAKYVEIKTRMYQQDIADNLARIETLEADIIANPGQEEFAADEIANLLQTNEIIENTYIPELEYRLANGVVYNDGSWQDAAITSQTSSKTSVDYATTYKLSPEEYEENSWMQDYYGTYADYEEKLEAERKAAEELLFVANSSLESGMPDMSFVPEGARQQMYNTFPLALLVILLGALIGGWCIAGEFQSGTIRLLMVRPRTRMVVLFTRYFAGLGLVYLVYTASFIINLVVKGVQFGMADYMLPNYTASSQMSFLMMFVGDFLAVSMSAVFVYSLSFAISTIAKNIAVSIIIPTIAILGSTIALAYFSSQPPLDFLAYTPLPYLLMYDFFGNGYNALNQLIGKGVPITMPLGAAMLALYSAVLMGAAALVFQKKDITN